MAREWSRRSIEELVRGYMRRHTPPPPELGCGGEDYMTGNAIIPTLYDAAGQYLNLPMHEIEIVVSKKLGASPPDVMLAIKFSEVPPVYYKDSYSHTWVLGLFAGYGGGLGYGYALLDLYDEAGGLVATVYAMESSKALNPFASLRIPSKLELTKPDLGGWSKFPGSFFGTEAIHYTTIYTTAKNATNPLPEGWAERVAFYKARSPYN